MSMTRSHARPNMLWIISGATSVGKSTFIMSPRCAEITGISNGPIVFAANPFGLDKWGTSDLLYHYNILRPMALLHENSPHTFMEMKPFQVSASDFEKDEPWCDLKSRDIVRKAIVLIANRQTILQRARQRQIIESRILMSQDEMHYPNQFWLDLIERIDLLTLYRAWCCELRNHKIPYLLIDSTDSTYPVLEHDAYLRIFQAT